MLKDAGYDVGKWGCDGEFGNDTNRAVVEFQKDKGLEADGIVGPLTWAALFK
jgi:N-acetylmuramoyl-L-alanine amidase